MNYKSAISRCEQGHVIWGTGWKEQHKVVYCVKESFIPFKGLKEPVRRALIISGKAPENHISPVHILQHFDSITEDGELKIGWKPTDEDMKGNDWVADNG